jgi:SAM-dependent methyltransferase
MQELLAALHAGSRVLDLGCAEGSFACVPPETIVIRVDLEPRTRRPENFIQADAARLPFPAQSFDAVISNHSLEHICDLGDSFKEIRRVIKPEGLLYVAVPDATTRTDRLYRWLARGGGHVNAFGSAKDLATRIGTETGLKHAATRTLLTSLSFLNRGNRRAPAPRKLWLLGGGTEISLHIITFSAKAIDRMLGSRLSVYGWALYFGHYPVTIDCRARTNVCVRCGSGHASQWLLENQLVNRRLLFRRYRCPRCGTMNLFTDDERHQPSA